MCTSCKKFIKDQLLTLNREVCHENWKCIYRKNCHLTLTNNLDLHNFLIIIESGSLSYWIQHTKLYIWGKSHALIIFWKLPLILAAKQLDYLQRHRSHAYKQGHLLSGVFYVKFIKTTLVITRPGSHPLEYAASNPQADFTNVNNLLKTAPNNYSV